MKKELIFLLALATTFIFANNLLENSSFEIQREANSSRPETWTALQEKNRPNTYSFDEKNVYSGKRALKISNQSSKLSLWMHSHLGAKLKKFPVGTELEFSAFVRSLDGQATARIYFESLKAKKLFINTTKISSDDNWSKIVVRFKVEDIDYGAPYVCLALVGKGSLVYDCAYLGPVGKNPWKVKALSDNFILNSSMEKVSQKGQVINWFPLNRSKNGKAYVNTTTATTGVRALNLECSTKPNGLLAWNYKFKANAFEGVKPETEMVLSLKANTHGNPATTFRFYIEFTRNGKFIGTYIAQNQTIYVGWQEKTLRFKMPKLAPTQANVYVQLLTGGVLTFDDVSLQFAHKVAPKKIELTPLDYCRISSEMPPLNTFIVPQKPSKFTIEYLLANPKLKVELFEIDGKKVKEWQINKLTPKKISKFDLVIPSLPKGAYELKFTCGKFIDYEWFRIRDKQTTGAYFMANNILNLDGKPFFPIGIITPENNLDVFRVYSQSGINTVKGIVSVSEQMAKYNLEVFKKFNFACVEWNNWGLRKDLSEKTLAKNFKSTASYLKNYKGFIGFMADEAPWNKWELSSMRRHYRLMYKYLPNYVAWMNNAPRVTGAPEEPRQAFATVRAYSRASDITGLDIYPVPEGTGHNNLPNKTISCVGDYTDLCFKLVWHKKPVWMILQAFGWSEGEGRKLNDASPRPNEKQLRFMVWNAITHGATGIFWFGDGARDVYSNWYRYLAKVSLELNAISKMMLAAPYKNIKGLPTNVSGIEGKGFKVIVNENAKKSIVYQGKTIEPQGVLFITDKPLNIPLPPKFNKQKTIVKTTSGIQQKTVLLNAYWTAHPQYLRGAAKTVYAKHVINVDNNIKQAFILGSVDDLANLFVNGKMICNFRGHSNVTKINIAKYLKKGQNIITFEVENATGPTGLVYEIDVNGKKYPSGNDTVFSFDNKSNWKKAHLFGKPPISPWKSPKMFIENN